MNPNAGSTNPELQPYSTPESPDNIVGSLDNPTLEVLNDSVVLEDPPEDVEDPIYLRNLLSLAESEGDEVSALPPVDAEEPHDDESMGNSEQSNERSRDFGASVEWGFTNAGTSQTISPTTTETEPDHIAHDVRVRRPNSCKYRGAQIPGFILFYLRVTEDPRLSGTAQDRYVPSSEIPIAQLGDMRKTHSQHTEPFPLLSAAYASQSLTKLVDHPLIRILSNHDEDIIAEPGLLVKNNSNRSLQAAFEEPYVGDLHRCFIEVLDAYSELNNKAGTVSKLYNKSICVIQWSGMGKSRLVDEAAKEVFTIPANLREELPMGIEAYPPPDEELRSYFQWHELKSDELLQAEYAILLTEIFDSVKSEVQKTFDDSKRSSLSRRM
ncbi:hypothetical protein OPQ81_001200 [Rhizoctonia solani]|nr:hypothetical protein OPQ81_001200 [Rhizoctonia solani]